MLGLVEFKKGIKKLNNKNICFVKIRADVQCYFCGTIFNDSECLVINSKSKGVNYLCNDCLSLKLKLNAEKSALNGSSFGNKDDFNYIQGVYSDLIERCKDKKEADRLLQESQNYR